MTVELTIKIRDYVLTRNIYMPTTTPISEICNIGEVKELSCPGGTKIITSECRKNTLTGRNEWVVTNKKCPPPSKVSRIVKILPEDSVRLPDANEGEEVNITAKVVCRTNETISKNRDTAYLIVDGATYDEKPVSDGLVTFKWIATAMPLSLHTICVKVNPSPNCKSPGQDCKRITVSQIQLSPAETIARKRQTSEEQRKLLEQQRRELRRDIVEAELLISLPESLSPSTEIEFPEYTLPTEQLTPISPFIPSVPSTPPDTGNIKIISMPNPTPDIIPSYIYIDNINIGRVQSIPYTVYDIIVGNHTVYILTSGIKSREVTVSVSKNKTTEVLI